MLFSNTIKNISEEDLRCIKFMHRINNDAEINPSIDMGVFISIRDAVIEIWESLESFPTIVLNENADWINNLVDTIRMRFEIKMLDDHNYPFIEELIEKLEKVGCKISKKEDNIYYIEYLSTDEVRIKKIFA